MATIVLSAAGMAIGGSVGGSVLGLSTAVIGRAVGASLGSAIDSRLLGAGSEPVETGRIDRFRLTGASEGHRLKADCASIVNLSALDNIIVLKKLPFLKFM